MSSLLSLPNWLRSIANRISVRLRASRELRLIEPMIARKWRHDRAALPLTTAHRELYENIHRFFWQQRHDFPNLTSPRDYNDRMQWLKLFDQNFETVLCSDKVRLREYVSAKLGPNYMADLFQVHDRFSQIDFERLPTSFVIKANHDSGTVVLVDNKGNIDHEKMGRYFDLALSRTYGWEWGEWPYRFVEPKVFVEQFIGTDDGRPPPDYKFYCSGGRVKFMRYICGRYVSLNEQTIDVCGRDMKQTFHPEFASGDAFQKPDNWKEMIAIAETLSQDFKFVRVDLYTVRSKIYVGEMTFWPAAGIYHGDGQRILGQLLDFDRTTFKPCILPQLLESSV